VPYRGGCCHENKHFPPYGSLGASVVVHVVGPDYTSNTNGNYMELDECLRSAYDNSLRCCVEHGVTDVGIPLISTGILLGNRDPRGITDIAVSSVVGFVNRGNTGSLKNIVFYGFTNEKASMLMKSCDKYISNHNVGQFGNVAPATFATPTHPTSGPFGFIINNNNNFGVGSLGHVASTPVAQNPPNPNPFIQRPVVFSTWSGQNPPNPVAQNPPNPNPFIQRPAVLGTWSGQNPPNLVNQRPISFGTSPNVVTTPASNVPYPFNQRPVSFGTSPNVVTTPAANVPNPFNQRPISFGGVLGNIANTPAVFSPINPSNNIFGTGGRPYFAPAPPGQVMWAAATHSVGTAPQLGSPFPGQAADFNQRSNDENQFPEDATMVTAKEVSWDFFDIHIVRQKTAVSPGVIENESSVTRLQYWAKVLTDDGFADNHYNTSIAYQLKPFDMVRLSSMGNDKARKLKYLREILIDWLFHLPSPRSAYFGKADIEAQDANFRAWERSRNPSPFD
jgi:Macro domain